jgi:starch phosphorylase
MTVLAMRLSRWRNGVSRRHGRTSRALWRHLWPGVPEDEVPIGAITNGVHVASWISPEMAALFDRYLGTRWRQRPGEAAVWDAINDIPDTELWPTHERRRERLVAFARSHLRTHLHRRGASSAELAHAEEVLHPEALTIGFARRFATYKRGTLLLRDTNRLIRLLSEKDRPVQIIFAGKAHPHDNPAKQLIRDLVHFARRPEVRHHMVFLEDYDMNVARYMLEGVDVWVNTPRPPQEASGTSGMKATANGALNLSVWDGWWCEGYSRETGWAIGRGETYTDSDYQDEVESEALYDLLEKEVVPLFYDRGADGLPRRWISLMKSAMRRICPRFSSNRMVAQYTEEFYVPAARRRAELAADGFARARSLATWKARVRAAWPNIRIEQVVDDSVDRLEVGSTVTVRASIALAGLLPSDVVVELYHGGVDAQGEIRDAQVAPMACKDQAPDRCTFVGSIECRNSGLRGYTVRVLPHHDDLITRFDLGLITWP